MSREEMNNESKMIRVLQFLQGDAKEAVSSLESATDGIHHALKALEERYGRLCVVQ